jgi:ATP synthase protein I
MFLRKIVFELCIYTSIASILWFFFDINLATSFLCGASVSFLSNTYSAYMLLVYQVKSMKEEARRFYIAEFGKWSISVILFALIFLYVDVVMPLVFFGAFIFSNLLTIFFTKLKISK